MESNDIKSRVVQTLTLDDWNTYDNGHTMIEVYRVDLQKWILYDLDNNAYFLKNGIPLSLIEFIDVVKHDNYEIYLLATDTTLDVSNFVANNDYEYAFYAESVYANENTLKIWYERVIQVPMISEDKFSYFTTNNVEERKQMESYASHHKFLPIDEFQSKVSTQVKHMTSTLNEFRSFFRPNKEASKFNVKEMIDKVLLLVKDEFVKNRITITINDSGNFNLTGVENEFKHRLDGKIPPYMANLSWTKKVLFSSNFMNLESHTP